ncbi:hypothetical protein JZ751_013374 [Albula glossodonta]|uniref:Uncharacterized protein n=1 Tax=Albula glossodonta TaxID=121402 RepID=A0A8T2MJZ6_9TELE|nr:hypothetical protein JZ751_013374 [Albula glossodonta]
MVRELLRPVFPSCSSLMTLSVELVTRSPDTRHSMLGEGFPRLSQEQLISAATSIFYLFITVEYSTFSPSPASCGGSFTAPLDSCLFVQVVNVTEA